MSDGTELVLRPAEEKDLPAVAALMNRAFRGAGPDASWNTEAAFLSGDRTSEAFLREEMDADRGAFLLLAMDRGTNELRGCVALESVGEGTWYLGSLTIEPLRQKGGLGSALLSAAEQFAQTRGARTIVMKVVNVRDTLLSWYERRGYRLTGESQPFPYGDTRFGVPLREDLAFVVLEKRISSGVPME